jgi:hypothetical protein
MDALLLKFLLDFAVAQTGYPALTVESLPPLVALSEQDFGQEVCPEDPLHCRNIVAVFDTDGYRIVHKAYLDPEDPSDHSFLLHELVHVLQHQSRGDAIFATCENTLRTETEAYRVQNEYLRRQGQLMRAGKALGFMNCAGAQNALLVPFVTQ